MQAINDSDLLVGKAAGCEIWTSLSSKYQYAQHLALKEMLVRRYMPYFQKLLKLPVGLKIKLGPIKGRSISGRYFNCEKTAVVEVRLMSNRRFLEVLAHELVHAEQYTQGRLSSVYAGRSWRMAWNGTVHSNRGSTYEAYRSQPWEAEAFNRQEQLAKAVEEMYLEECAKG